jgi:uncharacterized protein
MRILDHILPAALFGLGLSLGLTSAHALDGTRSPDAIPGILGPGILGPGAGASISVEPGDLKAWWHAIKAGDVEGAVKSLEEAAHNGDVRAAWKLGRMYADGDRVQQNAERAFEYFRAIVENYHGEELAGTPQARFVANAFVSLGLYYLTGIPESGVKSDLAQAHQKFFFAASYFGDPDAQYRLGRMYLDGQGVAKDPKQAGRWLYSAATKGQYEAQAVFGGMLFKGQLLARDGAKGLMWLRLAVDAATPKETWIKDQFAAAWKQATDAERGAALVHVEHWREQFRSGRRSEAAP